MREVIYFPPPKVSPGRTSSISTVFHLLPSEIFRIRRVAGEGTVKTSFVPTGTAIRAIRGLVR